jgi:hypothetical protein
MAIGWWSVYTLSIYAWSICPMYYVALMTLFWFFISNNGLLMVIIKKKVVLYMFLTIIVFDFRRSKLGNGKLHQRRIWCYKKGGSLLSLLIKKETCSISWICCDFTWERESNWTRNKGNGLWMNQVSIVPVAEVQAGFKAHPELWSELK